MGVIRILAEMYYYERGVPVNLETSAQLYFRGASSGDRSMQQSYAYACERGEGVDQSYEEALRWYHLAADQGKIHAAYSVGRMCEYLSRIPARDEMAIKYYTIASDKGEYGASFLLGVRHEQGRGVDKDSETAKRLFGVAASNGHYLAQVKLKLMAEGYRYTPLAESSVTHFRSNIARRLAESLERTSNVVLTAPIIVGICNLKEDYENAQKEIKRQSNAPLSDGSGLLLNYSCISADPYTTENQAMYEAIAKIDEDRTTTATFNGIFDVLAQKYSHHPTFEASEIGRLSSIRNRFDGREKIILRKMFIYLYDQWRNDFKLIKVPAQVQDANSFRVGAIAALLLQNYGRCVDGLQEFVEEELYKVCNNARDAMPIGLRISKVINSYKRRFILQHQNPLPGAVEEATEAIVLLQQRMRLPLGLPGLFQAPTYPGIGRSDDIKYLPDQVMGRFLSGGDIIFERGNQEHTEFCEAYTPGFLIRLLRDTFANKAKKGFNPEHVNDFCKTDPVIGPNFSHAFIEGQANEFFDPNASTPLGAYKDKIFERLLLLHGYIERVE